MTPLEQLQRIQIKNNPEAIKWIENPSLDLQLQFVDFNNIHLINNIHEKTILKFIKNTNRSDMKKIIEKLNIPNMSREAQLELLSLISISLIFEKIPNPIDEVQKFLLNTSNYINIEKFSMENIIIAIKRQKINPNNFNKNLLKNPIILNALLFLNDSYFYLIKNPTEKQKFRVVKTSPFAFSKIKNPSDTLIKFAIKCWPENIQHIQNPSEELQLLAVKKDPDIITNIENLSEKALILALELKKNLYILDEIKNKFRDVIIRKATKHYAYYKNLTEEEQQFVANNCPCDYLKYNLHMFSQENLEIIVNRFPEIISQINRPSLKLQFIAVKKNPETFQKIQNPGKRIQKLAVSLNPFLIKFIKNPELKIQIDAVKLNPDSIRNINDPAPEVISLAMKLSKNLNLMNDIDLSKLPEEQIKEILDCLMIKDIIE
jgi:hypothetical protein